MNAQRSLNERKHERFRLQPMYTDVTVQRVDGMALRTFDGHAYDISEAGVRIELDEPLTIDDRVALCLRLPGETSTIFVSGRVVWVNDDEDDPAARRMAVEFSRFLSPFDQVRLTRHLGSRLQRTAA